MLIGSLHIFFEYYLGLIQEDLSSKDPFPPPVINVFKCGGISMTDIISNSLPHLDLTFSRPVTSAAWSPTPCLLTKNIHLILCLP